MHPMFYFVTGTATGNNARTNDSRFKSMTSVFFLYFQQSNSVISKYSYFPKMLLAWRYCITDNEVLSKTESI